MSKGWARSRKPGSERLNRPAWCSWISRQDLGGDLRGAGLASPPGFILVDDGLFFLLAGELEELPQIVVRFLESTPTARAADSTPSISRTHRAVPGGRAYPVRRGRRACPVQLLYRPGYRPCATSGTREGSRGPDIFRFLNAWATRSWAGFDPWLGSGDQHHLHVHDFGFEVTFHPHRTAILKLESTTQVEFNTPPRIRGFSFLEGDIERDYGYRFRLWSLAGMACLYCCDMDQKNAPLLCPVRSYQPAQPSLAHHKWSLH